MNILEKIGLLLFLLFILAASNPPVNWFEVLVTLGLAIVGAGTFLIGGLIEDDLGAGQE